MNYKQWNLLPIAEGSGISIDYIDPQGNAYSAPFCFSTLDEALNYGKLCIDQLIRSKSLIKGAH
jgi:hypothetical protein